MIWRGHVFCVVWVCFTWNVPLFTFGDLSSTEWLMQQGSVVVPTISCLSWDVYDARLLNDFVLNALAVFILDTALVHVALVDDGGAVGFGCAKDTPKSLSFFVRSTGGSVCTKVVGGLQVGEGSWELAWSIITLTPSFWGGMIWNSRFPCYLQLSIVQRTARRADLNNLYLARMELLVWMFLKGPIFCSRGF